ncbi:hypothetical protein E8P82_04820 [Arthrobacter echini]|uniref:AbiEi antitoxin C-terminal domain-containing protein n=1 Tax=Arthrobacter echini TaxID=1529066 RepID=A0A4S5E759_9MICC|nr:hypothetical protein [Arthrobacter echini]THJ67427.1 hypothetical protein E8P82_04820 [Arthrobacter echini]
MPPLDSTASTPPERYPGEPPVTSTGGVLFHAGEIFTSAELQAMKLDGLVRLVIGSSYLRSDFAENPVTRSRSAAHSVPHSLRPRVALARSCAAWIYGCAPAPAQISLVTDHRRRTTALPPFTAAVMHQVSLGPFDVNLVGGVSVTTPLRTALDIAVHGDGTAVSVLRAIDGARELACPLRLVEAALLGSSRVPGKARALTRLRAAQQCG